MELFTVKNDAAQYDDDQSNRIKGGVDDHDTFVESSAEAAVLAKARRSADSFEFPARPRSVRIHLHSQLLGYRTMQASTSLQGVVESGKRNLSKCFFLLLFLQLSSEAVVLACCYYYYSCVATACF